jgi:hypothetical protein
MIQANKRNFLFQEVKQTAPERNGFDLSHENKQTCRAGKLYPFEILEALPNDDFEIQVEQFIRLNPMLSPTMHRLKSYWHWFFCPNRLAWTHWEEFISRGNGKKIDPLDYTPPEPPYMTLAQMLTHSPSKKYLSNRYTSDSDPFFTGDYAEGVAWFRTAYPELAVVDGYDLTVAGTLYQNLSVVFYRTPRLANALSIPDVAYPYKVIIRNTSNEKMWLVDVDTLSAADYKTIISEDVASYFINTKISLMPFVAQFKIQVDYYRDENLEDDYTEMLDYLTNLTGKIDTSDDLASSYLERLLELNFRCWEKDYFTTATTLPQKSPDVIIPGTGSAAGTITAETTTEITGKPYADGSIGGLDSVINKLSGDDFNDGDIVGAFTATGNPPTTYNDTIRLTKGTLAATSITTINQSGSGQTLQPTTVAQVRRAFALQRWFEKVVRTGTRYIESLKAFFNSDAGDARLQRPEYIGGMSTPIQISDVVQTSATDDYGDTVQGNLAGYGVASDNSQIISYHAPEHGFIIGFFSILARTSYAQGIQRLFSRETWLDYAWPEFEHIGEQGIRQKELAFLPTTEALIKDKAKSGLQSASWKTDPESIFGYQSRYSEYKQLQDRFGAGFSSSLDFWSLGRLFSQAPSLSKEFVQARISDRNFAVMGRDYEMEKQPLRDHEATSEQMDEAYDYDTYVCDFWLDIKKVTSLTLYSEPI